MEIEISDPSDTHAQAYHKGAQQAHALLAGPPPENPPSQPATNRRAPLTIRCINDILAAPDSPADLILSNGYLERGERTAVCGMGGIGKSRLIMQLAMMHRAGRDFLTWQTRSPDLRWLFLQTENGVRRLKRDLTAMLTGFTPEDQDAIKEGIFIHTLEGEDDGNIILTDPDNRERAIEAIQTAEADVVVWDPLRDCTGDDLNKDQAMTATLRILGQVTKAGDPFRTALVIHHAGEGKSGVARAMGYDRGAFGRNSKTLKGWVRAQFNLAPATPDDNSQIIVASGKCNNFEEFDPVCARLNPETLLYEIVDGFDFDAWQESLAGTREKPTSAQLCTILHDAGGMEKQAAIAALQKAGIGKHAARDLIAKAVAEGLVEETPHSRPGKKPAVFLTLRN